MAISKEILTDYKEVYEKALKLVNEESKTDPETEPFLSHYAARDLLLEMKENLKNDLASIQAEEADDGKDDFTYTVLLAFVNRDLGRIYVFTEEITTGEQYLKDCIDLTEPQKLKPAAVIPYIGALNELGIVYANGFKYKEAFDILTKSEQTFLEFKATNSVPMSITDVFGTPEEIEAGKGSDELEKLYTLCTFYMAQVYGHLGELEKSAAYCHKTLRRQLDSNSYEPIDFALNAATLSQYFIGTDMYKEARHHLAAATLVMAEYETKMLTPEMNETTIADVKETFKHRYADLARCWGKYGLALLTSSKERLYNDDDEKLANDARHLSIDANAFRFQNLKLEPYENRISADYCLTFDDAKQIFHFVIGWLDQAKNYYTLDGEATEYAKIIKDYAELYQLIAFFEEDPLNQAKMQKKRAKYYEDLLKELNPIFYMSICRECWYGAGLAYCAILDILLDDTKANQNPSPQILQKINQVCQKAIKNFTDFQRTYMKEDGITLKPNIDDEELKIVLYSNFHLGRLYYKMITPDETLQLDNMNNSLKFYKMFVDECAKHEAAKALQAEVGVSKEMVNLLPQKIQNIKRRMGLIVSQSPVIS